MENFTISCGTMGIFFDSERKWTRDIDLMILSCQKGTISVKATTQAPSTNQVPYTTTRVSHSQFCYSIPVTAGPKFLHLFFYPVSYYPSFLAPTSPSSFNPTNSFSLMVSVPL
ncbi:putative receptor-like protein kinase [Glycine soja]|nr:putative receptor-like protein kinase [Glycine max]